jgi:hypothetical protein
MKHRRITSILFGLLAAPCMSLALAAPPAAGTAQVPASSAQSQDINGAITSILMHRSGCFGFCPIYEVEVTEQGAVTFSGHRFVEKTGKHHGKVTPSQFQQLAALVKQVGFFRLQDRYRYEQDGCTTWATDNPTVDIIVTRGSKKKHVSYYYGCKGPSVAKQIVALSEAIDKITGTSAWIGNGGIPAPPPNSSVKRTQTR